MAFDDYKNQEWRVLPDAGPSAKHTEGDIVSFEGEADKVIIKCQRYGNGQYKESEGDKEGRIEVDGYVISMTQGPDGKRRITFSLPAAGSSSIGGSWTAEDTGSGAGGDK